NIQLGKNAEEAPIRSFRVFGWGRPRGGIRNKISLVALYNAPKFSSGAFAESYEGPTPTVMGEIAAASGLEYDGPSRPTDDFQVWLNFNTTRISFTEDMALHGISDDSSCMARVVTSDGVLRYKNLIDVLASDPEYTLTFNASGKDGGKKTYAVRDAKDISTSGISSHLGNNGMEAHTFKLDGALETLSELQVPIMGEGLPVNEAVRREIRGGEKVLYTGIDSGNVHDKYEKAFYQNSRFLGLFSERLVALVDDYTDIETFTCTSFRQQDPNTQSAEETKDANGKYLVGGKTYIIKGGSYYSEVFYMYRMFVNKAPYTDPSASSSVESGAGGSTSGTGASGRGAGGAGNSVNGLAMAAVRGGRNANASDCELNGACYD